MGSRKSDVVTAAVSLVAMVALLMLGGVGLELAGGGNTIGVLSLVGGIAVTPVVIALVPLLGRVRSAATDARTAAENTEELKVELNGRMDARMRRIVREELPGLVDESVRRVMEEYRIR